MEEPKKVLERLSETSWESFPHYNYIFDESVIENLVVFEGELTQKVKKIKKKKPRKRPKRSIRLASESATNDILSTSSHNDHKIKFPNMDNDEEEIPPFLSRENSQAIKDEQTVEEYPPQADAQTVSQEEIPIEKEPEIEVVLPKIGKKRKREGNKVIEKEKENYEEFKESAIKMFAELTGAKIEKPKKKSKKKKKKKSAPAKQENIQKNESKKEPEPETVFYAPPLSYPDLLKSQYLNDLDLEIREMQEEIRSHNLLMKRKAETIQKCLSTLANETFKSSTHARLYGSVSVGLAVDTSDIDLAICGLDIKTKENLILCQEKMSRALKLQPFVREVFPIPTARVPVIKIEIELSEIDDYWDNEIIKVDIIFDVSSKKEEQNQEEGSSNSIMSTVPLEIKFQKWIDEKKQKLRLFETLVILLKKLLINHGLNVAFIGGLNSYLVTIVVSAFLSICPENFSSPSRCLVEALRYYGYEFDPLHMFIDRGEAIVLFPEDFELTEEIIILDPHRTAYNAAHNVMRFGEIQTLFALTFNGIMDTILKYESGEEVGSILDLL